MPVLQKPVLRDINNSRLQTRMAMPKKDLTSDGTASFELNRKLFIKSYVYPDTNNYNSTTAKIEREALGLNGQQASIMGAANKLQKKWIGGNRDASSITKARRIKESGKVISNLQNNPISFVKGNDMNLIAHAKARVRGGGAANVPKAVAYTAISGRSKRTNIWG